MPIDVPAGLDGVVVTETAISEIDGEAGRLRYRGRDIEQVVAGFAWEDLLDWLIEPERLVGHAPAHDDAPMALLVETLLHEG
ncbi:MAG: citrate/2-methylcitrate synthase, partial [Clostridia bacterium]